jgi:hypothetical protein
VSFKLGVYEHIIDLVIEINGMCSSFQGGSGISKILYDIIPFCRLYNLVNVLISQAEELECIVMLAMLI